jgi:hypothetical protein
MRRSTRNVSRQDCCFEERLIHAYANSGSSICETPHRYLAEQSYFVCTCVGSNYCVRVRCSARYTNVVGDPPKRLVVGATRECHRMRRRRSASYQPLASHAVYAVQDDRAYSRGITIVACRDGSHTKAVANPREISPAGAMLCRKSAVGDIIEAGVLSAKPSLPKQRGKQRRIDAWIPTLPGVAVRGEVIVPL